MTTILLPCIEQLDYKDNLLETFVNLLNFYSLNLGRILSGGLGWSSHTVMMYKFCSQWALGFVKDYA